MKAPPLVPLWTSLTYIAVASPSLRLPLSVLSSALAIFDAAYFRTRPSLALALLSALLPTLHPTLHPPRHDLALIITLLFLPLFFLPRTLISLSRPRPLVFVPPPPSPRAPLPRLPRPHKPPTGSELVATALYDGAVTAAAHSAAATRARARARDDALEERRVLRDAIRTAALDVYRAQNAVAAGGGDAEREALKMAAAVAAELRERMAAMPAVPWLNEE